MSEHARARTVADIPIFHYEEVDSTQNVARVWLETQREQGELGAGPLLSVHSTDVQTAGRGRRDRSWASEPGSSALCTYVVNCAGQPPMSVVAALMLAVRGAINQEEEHTFVKWPNDLICPHHDDKKIAGCLTEIVDDYLLIGVGINLDEKAYMSSDVEGISLSELGVHTTSDELIDSIIRIFTFTENSDVDVMDLYRRASSTIGQDVTIEQADGNLSGLAIGITDLGELILETDSGEVLLSEGDVIHLRKVQ